MKRNGVNNKYTPRTNNRKSVHEWRSWMLNVSQTPLTQTHGHAPDNALYLYTRVEWAKMLLFVCSFPYRRNWIIHGKRLFRWEEPGSSVMFYFCEWIVGLVLRACTRKGHTADGKSTPCRKWGKCVHTLRRWIEWTSDVNGKTKRMKRASGQAWVCVC